MAQEFCNSIAGLVTMSVDTQAAFKVIKSRRKSCLTHGLNKLCCVPGHSNIVGNAANLLETDPSRLYTVWWDCWTTNKLLVMFPTTLLYINRFFSFSPLYLSYPEIFHFLLRWPKWTKGLQVKQLRNKCSCASLNKIKLLHILLGEDPQFAKHIPHITI